MTLLPWSGSSGVPTPIDHVMVTAGRPGLRAPARDGPGAGAQRARASTSCWRLRSRAMPSGKMRPGGTLVLMGGTGGRRVGPGLGIVSAATAALPAVRCEARAGACAHSGQPHRRRLRRHPAVGIAARRRTRQPPQPATGDAAYRPRCRPRRRRRARRPHHDQHGPHGRDVRHRRRAAIHLIASIAALNLEPPFPTHHRKQITQATPSNFPAFAARRSRRPGSRLKSPHDHENWPRMFEF